MNDDKPKNDLTYEEALHGVQAGVAMDTNALGFDSSQQPGNALKHLRVGVDSAMINDAALVRLLIKKGLFTEAEYAEEVRLEANRELDRYEERINRSFGGRVKLR